jgi:arsenate reductase
MELLFVCTHNRCRSILAEAVANHLGGGRWHARSAGSAPAGEVHPLTLRYLGERGIACEGLRSESWETLDGAAPDIVITVCDRAAGEACPLWLGQSEKVHWGLPDPSALEGDEAARRNAFLHTIDTLEHRLTTVLRAVRDGDPVAAWAAAMRAVADD